MNELGATLSEIATAEANPVLVEVTRGAVVESRHRGVVAIADAAGCVVERRGDIDRLTLPRSAIKPLQALPLVESGGADDYGLSAAEIALACASHNGGPRAVAVVAAWLARLGLGAGDLVCGGHPPADPGAARALAARGETFSALHDNCSGKHAAMLTFARALGAPTAGYEQFDHPVQQRIRATLADLTGAEIGRSASAIDGCGVPTYGLSPAAIATAMARFAAPDSLLAERARAVRRIAAAITAEPEMLAGAGRFDSEVVRTTAGTVIVKGGAEGVHAAALMRLGLGVAIKIDDGAGRAAECVMAAVLDRLGALDSAARRRLGKHRRVKVRTRRGAEVGQIRPLL